MSELTRSPSIHSRAALWLGLVCAGGLASSAWAQGNAGPPNFSAGNAGWVTIGTDWTPVPGMRLLAYSLALSPIPRR